MKQYMFIFILALFVGCKIKKGPEIRVCNRLDIDMITDLVPKDIASINLMKQKSINIILDMLQNLKSIEHATKTNFHNTVRLYDRAKIKFITNLQILTIIALLDEKAEMRFAANQAVEELKNFEERQLVKNSNLLKAFENYAYSGTDTFSRRDDIKDFMKWKINQLKHAGAHLESGQLKKLVSVQQRIHDLESQFRGNIFYASKEILFDKAELEGVSDDFIQSLKKSGNKYIVPCSYHAMFAILEHCVVEATRKKFFLAFGAKAYPQNMSVLKELFSERQKLAQILGYKNFAEYECSNSMAGSVEKVEDFVWDLVHKLQPVVDRNFEELIKDLPASVQLTEDNKLYPWDESFVKSWHRKNKFGIDDKQIAEYFPFDHVLKQMKYLFEEFFNVAIDELPIPAVWSCELKCWRVRLARNSSIVGYIFLDLLHRPGKIDTPCQLPFIPAVQDDCDIACSGATVISAGFVKPQNQEPLLLDFFNLKSLFHEFGHAFHEIFGATTFVDYAGTSVVKDFLEAPSQVIESLVTVPSVLQDLSKHKKTGKQISHNLAVQLRNADAFGKASMAERQCLLSLISLSFGQDIQDKDVHGVVEDLYQKIRKHIVYEPNYYFETIFAHLADYGSVYYGYIWSEVLAAGICSKIIDNQGHLKYVGSLLNNKVLKYGGSKDPHLLMDDFVGRNISVQDFLDRLG